MIKDLGKEFRWDSTNNGLGGVESGEELDALFAKSLYLFIYGLNLGRDL